MRSCKCGLHVLTRDCKCGLHVLTKYLYPQLQPPKNLQVVQGACSQLSEESWCEATFQPLSTEKDLGGSAQRRASNIGVRQSGRSVGVPAAALASYHAVARGGVGTGRLATDRLNGRFFTRSGIPQEFPEGPSTE